MNAAYAKLGKDSIARTAKFSSYKAKKSKKLDSALESNALWQQQIGDLYAKMQELRSYVTPYANKFVSGKCFCAKAKALLQQLQASLQLVDFDVEVAGTDQSMPSSHSQVLLRKSAKVVVPDPETYKLARAVQALEEKRAKLMQDEADDISGFSQQQRVTLER